MQHANAPEIGPDHAKDDRHDGPVVDRMGGYDIVDCDTCGFAHAWPLPSAAETARAYTEQYYAVQKPEYLARADEDAPWASMFYGDRLEALMSALGAEQPAGRSLLDVGCGPGNFLEAALRAGWRVQGVEPSHRAAQHAQSKGLRIHNRMFDAELARILAPFDAIHCMNVLEHVPDPIGLLSAIHKCIRPGGALCVGVPNDYNAFQRALRQAGKRPWWVVPPHHLNYFTFESLEALLRRCGFVPASRLTSYPMETFLLMGRDYVGDDRAGQEMHAERKAFDSALNALDPVIRRKFYQSLAAAGFGREAIVVAVRS